MIDLPVRAVTPVISAIGTGTPFGRLDQPNAHHPSHHPSRTPPPGSAPHAVAVHRHRLYGTGTSLCRDPPAFCAAVALDLGRLVAAPAAAAATPVPLNLENVATDGCLRLPWHLNEGVGNAPAKLHYCWGDPVRSSTQCQLVRQREDAGSPTYRIRYAGDEASILPGSSVSIGHVAYGKIRASQLGLADEPLAAPCVPARGEMTHLAYARRSRRPP